MPPASPSDAFAGVGRHALGTLAAGALGGFGLGVIARAWMRLISDDPEFSWSGTIFIVAGFTIFGIAQSIVAIARWRVRRRWKLTMARTIGAIAMLPLFFAAGAVMLPTVAGCGLAVARRGWRTPVRVLCLLVAAGPVVFVGSDLVGSFGWSFQTLAGFVLMLAIYAAIIWATRFTFMAQPDGWRPSRRARIAFSLVVVLPILVVILAARGIG